MPDAKRGKRRPAVTLKKKGFDIYRVGYMVAAAALSTGVLFLAVSIYIAVNFLAFASPGGVAVSKTIRSYMLWELSMLAAVSLLLVVFGALFMYRTRRRSRDKK